MINRNSADGSDDALRRLTDDLGRHRLTDVQEENEDDLHARPQSSSRRTRYSSIGSTASSVDYLWDLHPRRLSEAGLSRHSDNSTILTEDTDSFIIGQRIWVGGTKPGAIAYIGDTQFAPGEWAGIVLDQPIGKNDGSVGGIRYFQCEPKKGVFSRLTRLTRYPLVDTEMGSGDTYVCSTPVNNGTRRSPVSPTGSITLLKSPQSLNASNTSLASTHIDFKIGDRVIIKSSQGSKIGTLRYFGTTDFSSGEWCGVELDDPRGKNDGSVEGRRYFDCRPNFGLFAPASKVSKSPSNRKPGSCVVHSGPGIPPSGFKRANSKESLASNTSITSAASAVRRVRLGVTSLTTPQKVAPKTSATPLPTRTALQEVLKEKQQHVEQLLKERDLERAELARAASQADEAEQKCANLKQEYEQYRAECEKKLQEHMDLLTQLKIDREELVANLEDEKRKNEDLQFRFEEAAITKADIEVANEANIARITELEELLSAERLKGETLDTDSNKLFEAEEALVRLREENEVLKYEIEVAATKIVTVESECLTTKDLVNSLQNELNELHIVSRHKDETVEKLRNDNNKLSEDYDATKNNLDKEIEEYKNKIQVSSSECLEQKTQIEILKTQVTEAKSALNERAKAAEKLSSTNQDLQEKSGKEISKLKMELSAKSLDLENANETVKTKEEELKILKSELESIQGSVQIQSGDIDRFRENAKSVESALKKELEETRASLKTKIAEAEDAKKASAITLTHKDTELKEANKTIQLYLSDIEKLNESISEIKQINAKNNQEMQDTFAQKLEEAESRFIALNADFNLKNEELNKMSMVMTNLESDVGHKAEELTKLKVDLETAKNRFENEAALSAKSTEEISQYKLSIGDLNRKLEACDQKILELSEQKVKLENEVHSLIGSSGDYSSKLEELTKELREKEKSVEIIKNEFTKKLQDVERNKEEQELKYSSNFEKSERERNGYEEQIKNLANDKDTLKQQYDVLSSENNKTIENLNMKIQELQVNLNEKEQLLNKSLEEARMYQEKMKGELEKTSGDLQSNLLVLQNRIDDLAKENREMQDVMSKKSVDLIEAESRHSQYVEQSKQTESELKALHEEELRKLEFETNEKENQMSTEIETLKKQLASDLENSKSSAQELEHKHAKLLLEKENEKNELEEKIKNISDERELLHEQHEKFVDENSKILENLNATIKEREKIILEKEESIRKSLDDAKLVETNLKEQLGKTSVDLQSSLLESQKKINDLSKENNDLSVNLSQKSKELLESADKLKQFAEGVQKSEAKLINSYEDTLKVIQSKLNEKEEQEQKLTDELQKIKNTVFSTESSFNEKEEQVKQLKSELQINHQFVERILAENKVLLKQQESIAQLQEEKSKRCDELAEKITQLTEELQKTSKVSFDLNVANNLYGKVFQILQLTEKEKIKLVDNLERVAKSSGENTDESFARLSKLVDNIKIRSNDSEELELSKLRNEIDGARKLLFDTENRLKDRESEVIRLQNELHKASEESKVKLVASKIDNPVPTRALNNNPLNNEQLLEEKLFAESQVAFLNSIIVDMQKKNEEQKVRIEILESGYSPAAADELKLIGLTDRKIPPRMYCDICEEFDLHETEDCPQQASEDPPARDNSAKEKPPQRSYCEICEVFGHTTEDCQDDQTF